MRKLIIALAAAAGFALLAPTGAMAAPASGAVIDVAANEIATTTEVRHRRHCCCHRCWHPRRPPKGKKPRGY
jgi:hypothetical protein